MAAVKAFFKKEPVLVVSGALAFLSVFFVPPSAAYLSYIDFRTLGILFCLMAAVAGLQLGGCPVRANQEPGAGFPNWNPAPGCTVRFINCSEPTAEGGSSASSG